MTTLYPVNTNKIRPPANESGYLSYSNVLPKETLQVRTLHQQESEIPAITAWCYESRESLDQETSFRPQIRQCLYNELGIPVDRVGIYCSVFRGNIHAVVPQVFLQVRAGADNCAMERIWDGVFTPGSWDPTVANGLLVQINGFLAPRWELWGYVIDPGGGAAAVELVVAVLAERGGASLTGFAVPGSHVATAFQLSPK